MVINNKCLRASLYFPSPFKAFFTVSPAVFIQPISTVVGSSTKLFLRNVEGVGVLDVDFNWSHVKINGSVSAFLESEEGGG